MPRPAPPGSRDPIGHGNHVPQMVHAELVAALCMLGACVLVIIALVQ